MKRHLLFSVSGFLIWLLFLLILPPPSLLLSEELYPLDNAIITIGIGEITNNDLVDARERALEDAKKKAMIQSVEHEISSKIMEDNYRILNERIYQQSQRFIESYKVIAEVPLRDFYRITIRFALAQEEIRNELKALRITGQLRRPPCIMLMIAERDIGQKQYTYWWSYESVPPPFSGSILRDKFRERGMYVVNHISLLNEISQNKKYSKEVNLPDEAIRDFGRQFDVDIVISGTVEIEMVKSEGESSMRSVQANIAAKALRVEDGRVLVITSFHAPASSTDEATAKVEALKKVLGKFSEQVADLINREWKERQDSNTIFLKVIGLQGFSEFLKLKEEIKRRIPEIKEIYQRGISLENSQIDVETRLDVTPFIQILSSRVLEGFSVQVVNSSLALIELKVSPKTPTTNSKSTP